MTIELLSTRLANQIAAGEVVERPASVIKELVENSLDAGATKIAIDVEKGGSRLLRVRDNGCGVDKSELMLALSRHATSKIKNLDDLEAIVSLGFRGEALASISSVSRLHFSSKTAQQHEAWQAFAQGRDMGVELTPVAHPQGTTVEVADLFFNTPARRRFLRTEKTEFNHIDELIKRFALSRFDVEFVLKHNEKPIRNLKIANTLAQKERRVAAICSNRFMEHAVAIAFNDDGSEHNDVKLHGWLGLPAVCKAQSDVQYCYVNGRMMRDKLINHAIRQAYQHHLPDGIAPSYVLYIELDPSEVDVNVHPAKHEVRFHQARIIHDLITQVLGSALSQALSSDAASMMQPSYDVPNHQYTSQAQSDRAAVGAGISQSSSVSEPYASAGYRAPVSTPSVGELNRAASNYQQLITPAMPAACVAQHNVSCDDMSLAQGATNAGALGQALTVVDGEYLTVLHQQQLKMLSLNSLHRIVTEQELQVRWPQGFTGQPLLLPVSVACDSMLIEQLTQHTHIFRRLGIDITARDPQIIIKQVPQLLRDKDIAALVPQLLQLLSQHGHLNEDELKDIVCQWLAQQTVQHFSLAAATELFNKASSLGDEIESKAISLMTAVDFSATINALNIT